ncbi:hypothetical protein [Pedobacter nyackensis]|uniref:hypothetical protein n=1 Tax=Pedobacter nyackensis TaxID=475255 RepID=UPI00292D91D4|nr:hypothetical protein [Pedobacter nyackensis]
MKFKKFALGTVCMLGVLASFAFSPTGKSKTRMFMACNYSDYLNPTQCRTQGLTDDDCAIYGTGAQCTAWDVYWHVDAPAFSPTTFYPCTYPYYHVD